MSRADGSEFSWLTLAKVAAAALFAAGISGIIPLPFENMSGEAGPTSDVIVRLGTLLHGPLPASTKTRPSYLRLINTLNRRPVPLRPDGNER